MPHDQIRHDVRRSAGPTAFFAMTSFCAAFLGEIRVHPRFRRLFSCSSSFSCLIIGGFQSAVFGLPLIVGRRADPVLLPDFIDRAPGIGFFQNGYNLRFRELRLAHENRGGFASVDRIFQFVRGAWRCEPTRQWTMQAGSPSTRNRARVHQARDGVAVG